MTLLFDETTARAPESVETLDVVFPEGLVGFPAWQQFQLRPAPDDVPVLVLASRDEADLCFLAIDPCAIVGDYLNAIAPGDVLPVGVAGVAEALVLVFLIVEHGPLHVSANLLGPVVINPTTGVARQLVLAESGFTTRHPIESLGDARA